MVNHIFSYVHKHIIFSCVIFSINKNRTVFSFLPLSSIWLKSSVSLLNSGFQNTKKKIFLIHQDQPKSLIPINLNNMLKTGDMSQNVTLREGDILYLTKNHRIDFARDIAPIFSSIYMITEEKDNLDNN